MSPFTHIIAFKYRPDASAVEVRDFEQTFLNMENDCVKENGKAYVKVRGGKQVFPHKLAYGMEAVFIVDFESPEDAEYFHTHDLVHDAFVPRAQAFTTDAVILDFAPF